MAKALALIFLVPSIIILGLMLNFGVIDFSEPITLVRAGMFILAIVGAIKVIERLNPTGMIKTILYAIAALLIVIGLYNTVASYFGLEPLVFDPIQWISEKVKLWW